MACQHSPDDQTLRLQARAGEDEIIHLPSGPDRVACESQGEEEEVETDSGSTDLSDEPIMFVFFCLMSQQHASVSQGRICSDNCTCSHTEIEVADQTFYLTHSQHTDTGPTSPRPDPGAWQDSHRSANFLVTGMTRPGKILSQAGFEPRTFCFRGG